MIDQATIDKIIDRAEIVDVVSDFVSLHRRGQNLVGLCPFHEDKRPSFYVSSSKNICKCFACGEGGSPLNFIMKHESMSYVEALRYLAKKYGIAIIERELSPEEQQQRNEREALINLNDFVCKTFVDALNEGAEGRMVGLSYFKERELTAETIKTFQLGYSPASYTFISDAAKSAGHSLSDLETLGLVIRRDDGSYSDRFRERVIFPIHSISGNVVGFGGRIMKNSDRLAKYQNSPDSIIYNKRRELYGLYFAKSDISKQDKCLIVEGYMDVLSFHQSGVTNVVASSGTALTIEQVRLIKRFTNSVTLIFDSDAAGIKAALRGIDILLSQDMQVRIVLLPDGHDPDSFAKVHSPEAIKEYIEEHEEDFIRFKINQLGGTDVQDPHQRAEMINNIIESISHINDSIVREIYVRDTSHLLDISEENIYIKIDEYKKRQEEEQRREREREERRREREDTDTPPEESIQDATEPQAASPSIDPTKKKWAITNYEANLLKYLVRYGNRMLRLEEEDEKGKPEILVFSVLDLLNSELNDMIELGVTSPLFERIIKECNEGMEREGFNTFTFLTSHQDDQIREVANAMVADKTILSRLHMRFEEEFDSDQSLTRCIMTDILNFKYAYIEELINKELEIIKSLSPNNQNKLTTHVVKLNQYHVERQKISEKLGDRVVTANIKKK